MLRAPTAETGARAIAGTINIITREGFRRRLNELRISTGVENGRPSLGGFWSHNDNAGNLTYTLSAGLFANRRLSTNQTDTQVTDADGGTLLEDRSSASTSQGRNEGLNLNARLQWRLGEGGDSLTLTPGSVQRTATKASTASTSMSACDAPSRPSSPTVAAAATTTASSARG